MAGHVPAIHVCFDLPKSWMPGSGPGMTIAKEGESRNYSSGRATRKPMTLRRLPLGKLMRAEGLANSAS